MQGMKGKMTRRQMAGAMLAATAAGQAPQSTPAPAAGELQAAQEQNRRTGDLLAKVKLPLDAEPAFHFSA